MYEILNNLAARAPELFFGVLFITALWVVLREYRRIGSGIRESVQTEVAAQLGRTMGDIRISAEEATRTQEEIRALHEEIRGASEGFDTRARAKEGELNESFQHLQERLAKFELSLPEDEDDAKVPAAQIVHALRRSATWGEAAGLVQTLADDPDATSLDLETAGDRARDFGQFTLALSLYDLSRKKDPDRETVAIEYLTLRAQQHYEGREEALRDAMEVVAANPSQITLVRLANTLIDLERFELLKELCQEVLSNDAIAGRTELIGLCHRNLGTVYVRLNQKEKAREEFRKAYELDPDDENFLKGYASHVLEAGEFEQALPLYGELVRMDPFDGNYYFSLGLILEKLGRPEDAAQAYSYTENLAEDTPLADRARQARVRLEMLDNLPDFLTMSGDLQDEASSLSGDPENEVSSL